jgi:hypothetical protein
LIRGAPDDCTICFIGKLNEVLTSLDSPAFPLYLPLLALVVRTFKRKAGAAYLGNAFSPTRPEFLSLVGSVLQDFLFSAAF